MDVELIEGASLGMACSLQTGVLCCSVLFLYQEVMFPGMETGQLVALSEAGAYNNLHYPRDNVSTPVGQADLWVYTAGIGSCQLRLLPITDVHAATTLAASSPLDNIKTPVHKELSKDTRNKIVDLHQAGKTESAIGLPVRSQGDSQSDNKVMDNITVRQGETVFLRKASVGFVAAL
ncbi:hypothetical protein L3Q82_006375 [Scortum barcoo]|uniref:Uncharacterized protein n=1 Tax=Scortum barcoo TaxID=214431 RepID=A0ACB8WZG8_9TELE|nr:hypothetical protein L3Q82_006375 [Scortum barcoo]